MYKKVILLLALVLLLVGCDKEAAMKKAEADVVLPPVETQEATPSPKGTSTPVTSSYSSISKVDEYRTIFENWIETSLYPMCQDAYFNSKEELIIIVDSEWYDLSSGERKDIVKIIKDKLGENKKRLSVEGSGQFFSPAGIGLESFYAAD